MAGRAKPISKKKKKLGAFPISQRPIFSTLIKEVKNWPLRSKKL